MAHAGCPTTFPVKDVRVERPPLPSLPERDRIPYPDAVVEVSCMFGASQFVHRGDEALAAFEREALLADVLGVQV